MKDNAYGSPSGLVAAIAFFVSLERASLRLTPL